MSKPKKPPPPPKPEKPYKKMEISGPEKIFKIIEALRTLDSDGYNPYNPGFLAKIKGYGMAQRKGTVCSPFTGNVIGCALDPNYDTKNPAKDEFEPLFNGGNDALPFAEFYKQHNEKNRISGSLVDWNVGEVIDKKKMRKGDVIGIDWKGGGGHAVFCWDVHLDANGDVDCFQYLGANGHLAGQMFDHDEAGLDKAKARAKAGTDHTDVLGGPGVSIAGCGGKTWLEGDPATYKSEEKEVEIDVPDGVDPVTKKKKTKKVPKYKVVAVSCTKEGTLKKAGGKDIFVDGDEEISKKGTWLVIPGVNKKKIDETFAKGRTIIDTVNSLQIGRLFYSKTPSQPAEHKPVAPTPPAPTPKTAGHTEAPTQVVKGDDLKANPKAKEKVKPVPAKQEKDKTLYWQHFVEHALQVFYAAKWIDKDPGNSDDINDPKTQAALKAYQTLFDLDPDGKIGPQTLGSILVELPICVAQLGAQFLLHKLWTGKKLDSDPGVADGVNHDKAKAAVEEFQKKHGLKPTKVPDSKTHAKLKEVVESHAPTADKPGLKPQVTTLYWIGNTIDPGGNGKLRLHSVDLKSCEECTIQLHDEVSKKDVEASVKLSVDAPESEVDVPIPFPTGASVQAKVVTQSAGEIATIAALHVGRGTEQADWREFIDKDSVPDDVIEKIKRNRARWPMKKISLVTKGKYKGPKHYNYGPPESHGNWAREYIKTEKVDKAAGLQEKHIAQVFVEMMKSERGSEGQPASFQTYDNQIVTWGVGFGGMGDGVHIFDELNKDAKMQRLLDDLGVQYFGGRYHVVHVGDKKVVSSPEITKLKKGKVKHVGWDLGPPLEAWRDQMDAMSAIISISEDTAYRVQIIEAQWRVYVANSSTWTGQDKIYSLALYYLITHSQHWLPALAKGGFYVNREWDAIGGGTPSIETDKKLANRLLNGFLGVGKGMWREGKPNLWKEVHRRVNDDLWTRFKTDAKKEGFDAGEFVYTVDL
jgi:peptidoglycan hydrolase-like protein with peptidoglycan-binding domain